MTTQGAGFDELAVELAERFSAGVGADWEDFDDVARRVFEYQFRTNVPYATFARGRGITPDTLSHWRDIPAVPSSAFKHLELVSGDPRAVERVFRTSGTSRGGEANGGEAEGGEPRGRHAVLSLDLYRAAALPPLGAHLFPDVERIRILSLIPDARARPDSSLATMMGFAREVWGAPGGGTFVDADHRLDVAGFDAALREAADESVSVLVAGTAFAFVHWLEASASEVELPGGSRVMETGGFKGRSREVPRAELYGELAARLGLAEDRIVNEYGMTELLSQFWEPVLHGGVRGHRGPPWVRTRLLDPLSLHEVTTGVPGLLCHYDLANLGSVMAVLTEDIGVGIAGGFRVLGRVPGAEPRGCSLALEELLEGSGA